MSGYITTWALSISHCHASHGKVLVITKFRYHIIIALMKMAMYSGSYIFLFSIPKAEVRYLRTCYMLLQ